jgi:hypothetical protein
VAVKNETSKIYENKKIGFDPTKWPYIYDIYTHLIYKSDYKVKKDRIAWEIILEYKRKGDITYLMTNLENKFENTIMPVIDNILYPIWVPITHNDGYFIHK